MSWRELRRKLCRRRSAKAGLAILMLLGASSVLADFLASDLPILLHFQGQTFVLPNIMRPLPLQAYHNQRLRQEMIDSRGDWAWMPLVEYGPEQQPEILKPPPAAPDADHWLGTDNRGRDIFARIIHGGRLSLSVGFGAVFLYVMIGLILGVLGGYYGGWVSSIVARIIELGLTFPTFFLILIIMALLERASILVIILVLGVTRWTDVARLVRAEVLRLKELDFVAAAQVSGASAARIIIYHLIPNALSPVLVNATFGVASAILVEAALSFLGFGAPPPLASWGEIMSQAMENQSCWWLTVCPGVLLFGTILALNLVGEGLREALDPRLRPWSGL